MPSGGCRQQHTTGPTESVGQDIRCPTLSVKQRLSMACHWFLERHQRRFWALSQDFAHTWEFLDKIRVGWRTDRRRNPGHEKCISATSRSVTWWCLVFFAEWGKVLHRSSAVLLAAAPFFGFHLQAGKDVVHVTWVTNTLTYCGHLAATDCKLVWLVSTWLCRISFVSNWSPSKGNYNKTRSRFGKL